MEYREFLKRVDEEAIYNAYHPLSTKVDDMELLPTRANPNDAGLDLKAKMEYDIPVGERILVGTGVSVKIPKNHFGMLVARSSLSKKGLIVTNSVGIIDSDYRGELMVSVMFIRNCKEHLTLNSQKIEKFERIAQLVLVPFIPMLPIVNNSTIKWVDTERGEGGFGSSGTH